MLHAKVSNKRVFAGGGKPTQSTLKLLCAQMNAEVAGEGVWVGGEEWTLLALVDVVVITAAAAAAATATASAATCGNGGGGEAS